MSATERQTMSTAERQAARRAEQRQNLCAATARALTGDAQLHYRAGRLCRGLRPLPLHAPHLRADPQADDLASLRGAADAAALRIAYSDAALHANLSASLSAAEPVERLLFELFEQLRCESLVPPGMPGLAHNLRHRFESWSRAFHQAGFADGHIGILLYTVAQIVWSRLSGWPVLEETEGLIEATRAAMTPVLGVPLAALRRHRTEQGEFAQHALELARLVGALIRDAREQAGVEEDVPPEDDESLRVMFALWFDSDAGDQVDIGLAATGDSRVLRDAGQRYQAYTTRYDRELVPAARIRAELLAQYRERLDERIVAQRINVPRLAYALKAALALPRRDGWSFGEEHGRVDGRRLAQVISSPAERRVFLLDRYRPVADCMVSVLIDCSGSMRTHIDSVAVLVDVLARALDQAGVANEVLGFSTGSWNGGRARQDWLARGRPAHPGRLNEVAHLVFKDAATSWRRARTSLAALFKADLFREGVDGEALDWACTRLRARAEPRKILLVISDGSPMDSATAQVNDAYYLDNHLKQVVARNEAAWDVEVLGLGVGLDLSPYYRHCLAVDLSAPPDRAVFDEVVRLIGGRR